jgi:hypothetical protein
MKTRCAILGAGLLVAAATQAHAQAVQLRFAPPVGQITHYRTVSHVWATGDTTTAPMGSTLYTTRTVMAMDGPNYVVKTVTDSTVTTMPGGGGGRPGMGGDMMRGMAITQHMDPRGHVLSTEITPPPGLPPMVANLMQRNSGSNENRGQAVLPERPITPGTTWTDSMVTSAGGGRGRPTPVVFVVTYRFERVERSGGARLAIISMNGTRAGGLNGTVTGELALDLDGGRLARMTSNMTVQAQEGGSAMRMRMTMETLP